MCSSDLTIENTYTDYAYGVLEYYITATDANGNESGQSESVMIEIESLPGDVNDDYEVNIQDILEIGRASCRERV